MAPTDTECLEFWAFPWPVLTDCEARENVVDASAITRDAVRAFMLHAERPAELGPNVKTQQQKVRAEMLRFHPDKFNTTVLPKIVKADQGKAKEAASIVARALTELLAVS
ncbi:hypothetical protein PHLGIDRAFT_107119 [Phlebiopsis gigantea 11061_1 CR5-6]|uniref:Uncharacterized protein n=1 Tax=Phlebiopsis gigantea (strain 11061_1 CR5-6) TaxID=745531 RepID=A0A0C3PJG9_PHLG1|nr:hypothetical protein PHLGIDRAFT_107119 [Phlebiopsis gigantea 11061_1 CR5-6]